jgi:uroporphyrin-III C-methyltransferase
MLIETDLTGLPVLLVGVPEETSAAARRLTRSGAIVTTIEDATGLLPGTSAPALLVAVGDAKGWPVTASLRGRCAIIEEGAPSGPRGRVVLVGAGPGGPGLLTLDALKALAEADVILTDRLATVGDLGRFAPGAEVIDVGKRPGHHAVPQDDIQSLMVEHAKRGRTVVRLKGGDPYVFGRGAEEVEAAVSAGLSITVVPGITSAVAVPGAAGIPVTHRNVSHIFTVVSGHQPLTEVHAQSLVDLGGTIVLLMGVHNIVPLTAALLRAGLDPSTPSALIERGLTPDMRSVVAPIQDLADAAAAAGAAAPSVIVIGEVVRQSEVWAARVGHDEPTTQTGPPPPGDLAQRHTASSVVSADSRDAE